jgi:deferrochelatase/peroxidase EfeB
VGLKPRLARALAKSTKSSGLARAPFLGARSTTSLERVRDTGQGLTSPWQIFKKAWEASKCTQKIQSTFTICAEREESCFSGCKNISQMFKISKTEIKEK